MLLMGECDFVWGFALPTTATLTVWKSTLFAFLAACPHVWWENPRELFPLHVPERNHRRGRGWVGGRGLNLSNHRYFNYELYIFGLGEVWEGGVDGGRWRAARHSSKPHSCGLRDTSPPSPKTSPWAGISLPTTLVFSSSKYLVFV